MLIQALTLVLALAPKRLSLNVLWIFHPPREADELLISDCMSDSWTPVIYRFSGAGNDFVVLDGRQGGMEAFREADRIGQLCREYHTDGLMILGAAPGADFAMEFYNPDGSGGMMCGNGGRCIVAFADYLGLCPADGRTWHFLAPDGWHTAEILDRQERGDPPLLSIWTVRLKMIDVEGITDMKDGLFLNTGTRHYVQFVPDVENLDMDLEARPIRWDPAFAPEGTNVNFVQEAEDGLHVRTFEKGVEGETLACGTGLTASAIAWYAQRKAAKPDPAGREGTPVSVLLQCRRGDWLRVEFTPQPDGRFTDVYLTGPAELQNT